MLGTPPGKDTVLADDFAGICADASNPTLVAKRAKNAGYVAAKPSIQAELNVRIAPRSDDLRQKVEAKIYHLDFDGSHIDLVLSNEVETDGFWMKQCIFTVSQKARTNETAVVERFRLEPSEASPIKFRDVKIGTTWEDWSTKRTFSYTSMSEEMAKAINYPLTAKHTAGAIEHLTIMHYGR